MTTRYGYRLSDWVMTDTNKEKRVLVIETVTKYGDGKRGIKSSTRT